VTAPGRPLEFDPDQAVEAAIATFSQHGYSGTSMAELLESMDISRSSLYQAFGSKQDLFERCVTRHTDRLRQGLLERLERAGTGRGFIEEFLLAIADSAGRREGAVGCLLMNSASEFGRNDRLIAAVLDTQLERLTAVFLRAVKRAQWEGGISPDADPNALALYLHVAVSGLRTMIKMGTSRTAAREQAAVIMRAFR